MNRAQNRLLEAVEKAIEASIPSDVSTANWARWPGTRSIALEVLAALEKELD
jgi:hypothetical protein